MDVNRFGGKFIKFEDFRRKNSSMAKVLSILMVFTAHSFTGTDLWVPAAVDLFIFGFS
jgi:hypothetical protein